MVGKVRVQYGTELNLTRVFHGTPDGSAWAPNVFDAKNASNNARRDSSALLGHIAAFWNDFGPNATTYSEAYYALRNGLPALADKQWGGTLLEDEYASILPTLQAAIPGQNLDRRVASVGDELLNYDLSSKHSFYIQDMKTTIIKDDSGNGYNATTNCKVGSTLLVLQGCVMDTPLQSKGRNNTLTFTIKMSAVVRGPLFTGANSQLHLEPGQTTLISGANGYSVNYGFPIGVWVEASLVGAGGRTFLKITNGSTYEFLADIGLYGVQKRTAPIAIEAPLAQIGGGNYSGQIRSLVLSSKAAWLDVALGLGQC
jgi:hexosaminidase